MTRTAITSNLSLMAANPRLPLIAAVAVGFASAVTKWDLRHRTRNDLARLDAHLLKDIGLTEAQAHREAKRFFWQI